MRKSDWVDPSTGFAPNGHRYYGLEPEWWLNREGDLSFYREMATKVWSIPPVMEAGIVPNRVLVEAFARMLRSFVKQIENKGNRDGLRG